MVVIDKTKSGVKQQSCARLHINQQVSLLFAEIRKNDPQKKEKLKAEKMEKHIFQRKFYTKEFSGILYRTHCYIDLLDLQYIDTALKNGEEYYIELDTILSTYEGHTIFSIFLEKPEVYQQILNQLRELEFEGELNSVRKLAENGVLRRLYRILNMPTTDISEVTNPDYNCNKCGTNK